MPNPSSASQPSLTSGKTDASVKDRSLPALDQPIPTVMTAAVIRRYGSPVEFGLEQLPVPKPRGNQVLIRIHAASVNPIDYRIRQGQLKYLLPGSFPLTLGYDVAGEVVATGANLDSRLSVGDEVMSFLDHRHGGGYAEYVAVNASAVVRKPRNLSMTESAAIPLAGTTALKALRDLGGVKAGNSVLVNGASGGVGHFAVQLAAGFSARVTGVCSQSNLEFVERLGAGRVIDYNVTDFTEGSETYDIVFDAVAKSSFSKCRKILKPGGCYITTVPSASTFVNLLTTWFGRRCRVVLARPNLNDLQTLRNVAEEEIMVPTIFASFPLAEVARAHEISEGHHVRGKIVLS